MCTLLHVSPSGYYAWLKRPESPRSEQNRKLEARIRIVFSENRETYGAPRVHAELMNDGIRCGKNRVARIMRKARLKACARRKFKATTNSRHRYPVAANVLNQSFSVATADSVWAGDITYIPTAEGWLYLAVLLDLYSRKVIGWSMSKRMSHDLVVSALKMAIGQRPGCRGAIHHSDRGSQYACDEYQRILKEHGLVCSMSRKGNCYDNAVVESFFHTLKIECVRRQRYRTRQEAKQSLFDYIEIFYNRKRRHSTLNYMNPNDYERLDRAA